MTLGSPMLALSNVTLLCVDVSSVRRGEGINRQASDATFGGGHLPSEGLDSEAEETACAYDAVDASWLFAGAAVLA